MQPGGHIAVADLGQISRLAAVIAPTCSVTLTDAPLRSRYAATMPIPTELLTFLIRYKGTFCSGLKSVRSVHSVGLVAL
jgi:hypothetical protein